MLSLACHAAAGDVFKTTASGSGAPAESASVPWKPLDSDDRALKPPFQAPMPCLFKAWSLVQSLEWKVFDRNGNFLYSEQNRNLTP